MFETTPPLDSIERVHGLSHRDLFRRYVMPMRPVVVTDAINHWRALGRWTPEFFRNQFGSVDVTIEDKVWKLGEYIDALLRSAPDSPAPYLHNQLLEKWIPELMADITPLPSCVDPNWLDSRLFPTRESLRFLEVYIGGSGARFPILHYDALHLHAWLMQIYGTKRYVVFPPEQTEFLYPGTGEEANRSVIQDVDHPDLERFPLFAKATPTLFDLHPGETLFVPAGWWHTVKILSSSITISVNAANRPNWDAVVRDFVRFKCPNRSESFCAAIRTCFVLLGWGETLIGALTDWTRVL
jgi:histone arginine demethylase JMJD6